MGGRGGTATAATTGADTIGFGTGTALGTTFGTAATFGDIFGDVFGAGVAALAAKSALATLAGGVGTHLFGSAWDLPTALETPEGGMGGIGVTVSKAGPLALTKATGNGRGV